MRYKNVKTGAVIETSSKIRGENWKEIKEQAKKPAPAKRKAGRKAKGDTDD